MLTWTPEFNVVLFAFLLNLPWELWQVPLFDHMPLAPHWEAVKTCSRAAVGDAVIALVVPPVWNSAAESSVGGAKTRRSPGCKASSAAKSR